MAQDDRNPTGSEDASAAREHVRAAEENRDALADQARRNSTDRGMDARPAGTDANADRMDARSDGTDGTGGTGMDARSTSTDTGDAREHVRAAEENRDALADEARRVEQSLPNGIDTTDRR